MTQTTSDTPQFKIALLGDPNVGKSSYISRLASKETGKYDGFKIHPLNIYADYNHFTFNVYDTNGQEKFGVRKLREEYYLSADAAIIIFDVTCKNSYKSLWVWHRELCKVCENIPVVICGNKVDRKDRIVRPRHIVFHRNKENMTYFDISVKSNYNLEKPLIWIGKKLTGEMKCRLYQYVCTVQLRYNYASNVRTAEDVKYTANLKKEFQTADYAPLPEDDEL